MELEPLIRELMKIDRMMLVVGGRDVVSEMYVNPQNEPELDGSNATLWGDQWHVHFNLDRITEVQFVEAEDHGVPFLYYVRFSDADGETVIRAYFPNPYLDDQEQPVEFQPKKLRLFEEVRDRYVGQEGIIFAQRPRQG